MAIATAAVEANISMTALYLYDIRKSLILIEIGGEFRCMLVLSIGNAEIDRYHPGAHQTYTSTAADFDDMIISSYGSRKVAISTEVPYADMWQFTPP